MEHEFSLSQACLPRASTAAPSALASLVQFMSSKQPSFGTPDALNSPFHNHVPPPISLVDFALRMQQYMCISMESYVIAATFIAQLEKITTPLTAHRLLLTSVVLASKVHDDLRPNDSHFASVGGVTRQELHQMELDMTWRLGFSLFVSPEQYAKGLGALSLLCVDGESVVCELEMRNLAMQSQQQHHAVPKERPGTAPGTPTLPQTSSSDLAAFSPAPIAPLSPLDTTMMIETSTTWSDFVPQANQLRDEETVPTLDYGYVARARSLPILDGPSDMNQKRSGKFVRLRSFLRSKSRNSNQLPPIHEMGI